MDDYFSREFSLNEDIIYLNHAAVGPWPRRTAEAVKAFADENAAKGSLDYLRWLATADALRVRLKTLLNTPSKDNIALVKNTSEALSFVAYGLDWAEGDNIVSTNQEFPSNRIVWESLASKGVEFREADIGSGKSPEDALFALVDGRTRLITVSSVQFGTGLSLDLSHIGEFCKRGGILFCVDAIQSLGAISFDAESIHADFVMADGHKWMLGPEGVAVFYSSPNARDRLGLSEYGWNMVENSGDFDAREWKIAPNARRFECGSPNMLGIHALEASLSLLLETGMEVVERRVLENSSYLFESIRSRGLKLITDDSPGRYAGIVTFGLFDGDNARLHAHLTQNGVLCAFRSGGIRFSPHFYTPQEHLRRAMAIIVNYKP